MDTGVWHEIKKDEDSQISTVHRLSDYVALLSLHSDEICYNTAEVNWIYIKSAQTQSLDYIWVQLYRTVILYSFQSWFMACYCCSQPNEINI